MSEQQTQNTPVYGGIARRLGASCYDLLLLCAALLVSTLILMPFTQAAIPEGNVLYQIYIVGVVYIFYAWFWVHGGQTLGMRAWKIRVELDNGDNLGWGVAALRLVLAILTFGAGLLWCLWDPRHRALYDVLARTQVIRVDKGYVPPGIE